MSAGRSWLTIGNLSLELGGGVDSKLAAMAGIGIRRVRLLGQLNASGASLGLQLLVS